MIKGKVLEVILIQETHSDDANEVDLRKEWEGNVVLSHKTSISAKLAILFAKNFSPAYYEVEEVVEPGQAVKRGSSGVV